MPKTLQIAVREYFYNLRKPSFLFAAFGTPLMIIVIWVVIFAFSNTTSERPPIQRVGMVDRVGIIVPDLTIDGVPFDLIPYTDEATARADLDAETIEVYFVLPEGFKTSGILPIYAYRDLPIDFEASIRRLLVGNISHELGVDLPLDRLLQPINEMDIQLLDSGRVVNASGMTISFLAPFLFAILFWTAMQTTGNFLMTGLVEEKKNRIIEILVTTVTPMQLLLGKILGLGVLGLTQVLIWLGVAFLALSIGPQIDVFANLSNVQIPPELVIYGILFFSMGYLFNASLLAGVGVLAGNEQQSAQYSALILLPGYLPPIFLIGVLISDPNSTLPVILTLIPVTAPMTVMMRIGFSSVPAEQIALSLAILVISTLLVSWAAGKVFRWALLLYGKKINLMELLRVVFSRQVTISTSVSLPESQREGA